jgi:hypothetical protein
MQYLCARHQKVLLGDRQQAASLWQGAMSNGGVARRDGNLTLARSFYGTAFEIALLHVHQQGSGDRVFDRNKLISAGLCLGEVLRVLQLWSEADGCHRLLRDYLMIVIGDESLPEKDRQQAIDVLNSLRQPASENDFNAICAGSMSTVMH